MQNDHTGVRRGAVPGEHRILREGLIAGLIGALAVAAWFFLLDLVQGRLLFTPSALGSALFLGVDDPGAVQVNALTILGYTVLHFGLFAGAGLIMALVVEKADEYPPVLLLLVLLFVTFETFALGLTALLAAWLVQVLSWWSITLANLIAAAVMGAYLWKAHPGLTSEMDRAEEPTATAPPPR